VAAAERRPVSEAGRIAKFMGLADWAKLDDLGLVERVAKGFPVKTATIVIERLDPKGKFVRATDIIPKSTLHRRKHADQGRKRKGVGAVEGLLRGSQDLS